MDGFSQPDGGFYILQSSKKLPKAGDLGKTFAEPSSRNLLKLCHSKYVPLSGIQAGMNAE